jgi:hypothetical protein
MSTNKKLEYLTVFNKGFSDFAKNNVLNFKAVFSKDDILTMVALDKDSYEEILSFIKDCNVNNIKLKLLEIGLKDYENFDSINYRKIVMNKFHLCVQKLQNSEQLYFFDSDVYFFKNPIEHVKDKLSKYDIVFQVDNPFYDRHKLYSTYVCTGNFAANNNDRSLKFLKEVASLCNSEVMDGNACCTYLNSKCNSLKEFKDCKLDVFNPFLVQNGCDSFVKSNWHEYEDKICIHANHIVGKQAKIDALKKLNAWLL